MVKKGALYCSVLLEILLQQPSRELSRELFFCQVIFLFALAQMTGKTATFPIVSSHDGEIILIMLIVRHKKY